MRFGWKHYVTPELIKQLRRDADAGLTKREAFDKFDSDTMPRSALNALVQAYHIVFRLEGVPEMEPVSKRAWSIARHSLASEIAAAKREMASAPPYKPAIGTL